jgi:hypothetical protein
MQCEILRKADYNDKYRVPYMLNENEWNWNLKTAWFYAGVGLPFVIASWFLIPETARYVKFGAGVTHTKPDWRQYCLGGVLLSWTSCLKPRSNLGGFTRPKRRHRKPTRPSTLRTIPEWPPRSYSWCSLELACAPTQPPASAR